MKRGVIFLIVLVLCIPSVLSIGLIYPRAYSKMVIPFEPNGKYTLNYNIQTNAGTDMDYNVWAEGDMSQYVAFDPEILKNVKDGSTPGFSATINFPESADPGPHGINIFAGE